MTMKILGWTIFLKKQFVTILHFGKLVANSREFVRSHLCVFAFCLCPMVTFRCGPSCLLYFF